MLEEAFNSTTFPPGEAALALLSFVRYELPAGGTAAEARFLRLFSLLCDRLFGPIDMDDAKAEFRHQTGGWLSRSSRWDRPGSSSSSSSTRTNDSSFSTSGASTHMHMPHMPQSQSTKNRSYDADPVVQLLQGIAASLTTNPDRLPTLIEAISDETEHRPGVRFPYPFPALPQATQDAMIALLRSSFGGLQPLDSPPVRDNISRLTGSILRVRIADQNELRLFQQKKAAQKREEHQRPLQLSPKGQMVSPRMSSPAFGSPTQPSSMPQKNVPPNIMLGMLEYYLFAFIRYPLAAPIAQSKENGSSRSVSSGPSSHSPSYGSGVYRRPESHYGESVYSHLFKGYLQQFLPQTKHNQPFVGFSQLSRESELFLRVISEFWFDGSYVLPTTLNATTLMQERCKRVGTTSTGALDLNSSYDIIHIKYSPPPSMVQTGIINLVSHLVGDPVIALAVTDGYEAAKSRGAVSSSAVDNDPAAMQTSMVLRTDKWCLGPSMTAFQQSFFNYIRATLRHAPIHVSKSPFYTAMDAWLVWLEPWNVTQRKTKRNVTNFSPSKAKKAILNSVSSGNRVSSYEYTPYVPKLGPGAKSKYLDKWEPYIAANLHMYTVPLAIFLRRSRELDFSSKEFQRSMKCVQRVFRVYTPVVVETINRLLAPSLPPHPLVAKHEETLGAFSPTLFGQLSLSSCEKDMRNLLEEIYMQHMKTMRELDFMDRLASKFENLFGQGLSSDETALKSLVRQAKVIVNLPDSYEVVPVDQKNASRSLASAGLDDKSAPERLGNGLLTDTGKQQLVAGTVKMNPMDIPYIGDNMRSRSKTYELSFLVSWTIWTSNWINMKLGLIQTGEEEEDVNNGHYQNEDALMKHVKESEECRKHWVRINLRFLADYRNILFIIFVSYVWKMFRA